MLKLPASDHPLRELFTVEHLVELTTAPIGQRPTFRDALLDARRVFETASIKPSRIFAICMRANDEWQLVSFGPRGGVKVEWRFGFKSPRMAA